MRNRSAKYLGKPKVIQSWSKENLYNLRFATAPYTRTKTFFQQKWMAKSLARAYHGEQVREGQWERMFSRRLRAVVPMNARKLAQNDGTRESAGRGSGLEEHNPKDIRQTPYMQMTFAPLERRLDVAIFRAMFASSTRQARQFVVHGNVTVNGQKMRYPGYLLNPGDLFQVDPRRVLFATGAPKSRNQKKAGRLSKASKKTGQTESEGGEDVEEASSSAEAAEVEVGQNDQILKAESVDQSEPGSTETGTPKKKGKRLEAMPEKESREALQKLLSQAKKLSTARTAEHMMKFKKSVRSALAGNSSEAQIKGLEEQLRRLQLLATPNAESEKSPNKFTGKDSSEKPTESSEKSEEELKEKEASETRRQTVSHLSGVLQKARREGDIELKETNTSGLSEQEIKILKHALRELEDNPVDSTAPYKTPWQPRDWMSAFAFIPRYLEVNHTVCAAVYLRHPVARPGLAEVPTPYNEAVNGAAFAWYLRRR